MNERLRKEIGIRVVLYSLMIVMSGYLLLWLKPAALKEKFQSGACFGTEQFLVNILKHSNIKVAFLCRDRTKLAEKVVEKANKSNHVYSLVEYHYAKEKLVAYEPEKAAGNGKKPVPIQKVVTTDSLTETTGEEKQEEEQTTVREKEEETTSLQVQAEPQTEAVPVLAPAFSLAQLYDYDFLRSNLYVVPARASVLPEDLNAEALLGMDMSIPKDPANPQILIYHTHGSEAFADSTDDLVNTGIIAVGTKLAKELSEKYGYNVIHCTEVFDNVNGVFDRSKAYDYSRAAVLQILTDHPTIQVMIDLHRDGLDESMHLVTEVNGKPTAKIMFFNGVSRSSAKGDLDYLYNRYRSENLSFSLQAKLEAMCKYPDFTRKNYIDAYQYNLDLLPRAMLIESGAQTNTLEEELNAMEPLADILNGVLSGESRTHLGEQ